MKEIMTRKNYKEKYKENRTRGNTGGNGSEREKRADNKRRLLQK
jgi:hypothetical protein